MFNLYDFGQLGALSQRASSTGSLAEAALLMDFTANVGRQSGVVSSAASLLTVSRASVGYAEDLSGNWISFANDVPRITNKGLLVESVRGNNIRNNSMQGAVPGTPGTSPTNWAVAASGLTIQIVGVGVQNGIDYIDYRLSGITSSTSGLLVYEGSTTIAGLTGQLWVQSAFYALIAGSMANVTALRGHVISERTAAGALVIDKNGPDIIPTLNATFQRFAFATTTSGGATTAFLQPKMTFAWASGAAIDFTLRIGWPQLENGLEHSSPIRTTAGSVARQADVITTASFAWYAQGPGTLFAEFKRDIISAQGFDVANLQQIPNTDWLRLWRWAGGPTFFHTTSVVGSSNQCDVTRPYTDDGAVHRIAGAYATNDFQLATDGAVGVQDTAGTMCTPTTLYVGSAGGATQLHGYVRTLAYWPTRLTDTQLQTLTAITTFDQAVLDLNFVANTGRLNTALPDSTAAAKLTVVRTTAGAIDDAAGNWVQVAANQPRISNKGLLIEDPRTNYIRNNSMIGAVPGVFGSGGVMPTNWAPIGAGPTFTIVGTGTTTTGIDYIDLRVSGMTAGANGALDFETTTGIAIGATGQIWATSSFLALIAGDLTNVTSFTFSLIERTAAGALVFINTGPELRTSLTSALTRFSYTVTTSGGGTVGVVSPRLTFLWNNPSPVDFTIRIGWPQAEFLANGNYVSSPIRTTGAALLRGVENVDVATLVPTVPASLFAEVMLPQVVTGTFPGMVQLHGAAPDSDRMGIFYSGATMTPQLSVVVATVAQASLSAAAVAPGAVSRSAAAMALNDFSHSANGAAVTTDVSGTVIVPAKVALGRLGSASNYTNGYIRRATYWNTRLLDAQLQALST